MSQQHYSRPPITEAVVEVRFAEPINPSAVRRASNAFATSYPNEEMVKNVGFQVEVSSLSNVQPTAQINQEMGYRRSSHDLTEISVIWPSNYALSQLAPYPGWDAYFARFKRDWETFRHVTNNRKIIRIGVRFINRIDVRVTEPIIEQSEYLNVYPQTPDLLGPMQAYGVQAQIVLADIDCSLSVNSSSVPSPLLGHVSFILDLDIYREVETPQRDDGVYTLLNDIRFKKNEVFEACITNQARELFRK